MSTYKRWTDDDLRGALARVEKGLTFTEAARYTGVPRATIRRYWKQSHDATRTG